VYTSNLVRIGIAARGARRRLRHRGGDLPNDLPNTVRKIQVGAMMDHGRQRIRRDHNRVEPGNAIGIAIRVPADRLHVVADLLAPGVSSERVWGLTGSVTIYATVGHDSLNGRPVPHRWASVIADPPAGVPPDDGIGGLACIGAQSSDINRMWWRHGLGRVRGRLSVALDPDRWQARVRIVTAGGTMTARAMFEPAGEPWVALPQHYHVLNHDPPVVFVGDEWGTRHDGSGSVEFRAPAGLDVFDAYVGLDLDLGWDYALEGA
jgi:hypothetical protein